MAIPFPTHCPQGKSDSVIRRISEFLGSHFAMLAAAAASAFVLVGCADLPGVKAEDVAGAPNANDPYGTAAYGTPGTASTAGAASANGKSTASAKAAARSAATALQRPSPATSYPPGNPDMTNGANGTNTITLPDRGRVSLSEYRAQMREQLMKSEGAASDVADCAAHASWVVPRSSNFDALKIPTGALGAGQAVSEPWSGRFSQGKQAVPVSTVVTFNASAHKRSGGDWQPVRVRCGYDDGMMLAYELLDAGGTAVNEPSPAPAAPATRCTTTKRKGKTVKSCHSTGSSASGDAGGGSGAGGGKKSSAKGSKASAAKSTAAKSTAAKSSGSAKTSSKKKVH